MKHLIIGNMTGNSMDAIDLVLTEFDGDKMKDICTYTKPYDKEMQNKMEILRGQAANKTTAEILALPIFKKIHDTYVTQIAECINEMLKQNNIDKTSISAIGFHGKTLDHYPPSRARKEGGQAYTLQIGSGQMLADLTGIPVVYDFRSAPLMAGFDGAPLVPPHNAHIAASEGNGCYYNGGNTSNFAWIIDGTARMGSDAGPFNEYTDNFIRTYTQDSYDKDGKYGLQGQLDTKLLQKLFDKGRPFYETKLPKSGDPQYYFKDDIFKMLETDYSFKPGDKTFCDIVHTLEYFSAYIAVHALTMSDKDIDLPPSYILFGGGWKNPVASTAFANLIKNSGYVLPEHRNAFAGYAERFATEPTVRYSNFGEYMEARLFADLAHYRLENRAWEIPEIVETGQKIVCGVIAHPQENRKIYRDMCNLAAKGWQADLSKQLKQNACSQKE